MKKIYLLVIMALFGCYYSNAQNPLLKQWDARFGGNNTDYLSTFKQTADGGYILGGYSNSGVSGVTGSDKSYNDWDTTYLYADYWIVKIDGSGNKQWDNVFGGIENEVLGSIEQTKDKGYIMAGTSYSDSSGNKTQKSHGQGDYWVVKTDSLGNKQWDKRYGGTNSDIGTSVLQTNDGGFLVGGYSASGATGATGVSGTASEKSQSTYGGYDYWIIKVDSAGNKQWDQDYGSTDGDYLLSMQQTTDGGYILGGYSNSDGGGDKTQNSQGLFDFWLVKTDSAGNKQWDKDFGGTDNDFLVSLQQTKDGGYIMGGISFSQMGGDKTHNLKDTAGVTAPSDYWIVKVDASGNKQWDYDYGGFKNEDDFGSIVQTNDGGYLMAGSSYSDSSGDKTENNLGAEQTWVVKIDSAGNKQWDKTLLTNIGQANDEIGFAIQTADGCYAMANYTLGGIGGDKTQISRGMTDYWIIKFCDTTSVAVLPPSTNFLASDTVLCANDCISFTNLTANATSYQWYFAGALDPVSTDQNPQNICYAIAGKYDVTLIATNSGGNDTLTFNNYITVKPAPQSPFISQTGSTLYFSTSPSYFSYQWYDSTALISGATDTFLVVTHPGNYNVAVTDTDGCKISVGITVGIQNYYSLNTVSVSPNPAINQLTIQSSSFHNEAVTVSIMNVLGETILMRSLSFAEGRGEADVSKLAPGIYFLQLKWENGSMVKKFVKE